MTNAHAIAAIADRYDIDAGPILSALRGKRPECLERWARIPELAAMIDELRPYA